MHSTTDTDELSGNSIIVIGAGLVGAVQALLLAKAGFNVTIIEKSQLRAADVEADSINSRTVALSHRSWQLLSHAGLWPDIDSCPIQSVQVTEQGNFGSVKLDARKLEVDALGYVLSNAVFESYLHGQLKRESNVVVVESAVVVAVKNNESSVCVTVEQSDVEQKLIGNLVIAADGTHSVVRGMLGIKTKHRDYKQCALLANVQTSRCLENTAFERFTRDGPLALLPLSGSDKSAQGHWYSMIYTAPADQASWLKELSDKDFLALVQKKFGGKLGRFENIGKRYQAPLSLTESLEQSKGRFVLIGNAVRTLHPVAGQGMNLALRDVFELVACVGAAENIDESLQVFEKQRSRDQWLVTQQTDLLARVFTDKPWPLRLPLSVLTGSAFMLLDFIEPVKKVFAATNMGHHVPLPAQRRDCPKTSAS